MPVSPLAGFALTIKGLVDSASGSTAYTYETLAHGASDVPLVTLTVTATPSIYTDCSGWVNYVLDTVAPIHQAVAAAERNDARFNPGSVSAYGGQVTIQEAAQPWARADVLSYLFGTVANGSDGFSNVTNFSGLQAGDLIAYSTGIFTDPSNPAAASDPTLVATNDTGHTMVVLGTPFAVPMADWGNTAIGLSANVAAVYAVAVVDSSNISHFTQLTASNAPVAFTQPQSDTRSYAPVATNPPNLPPSVPQSSLQSGGLGAGTIWFAVDASGTPIQFRFDLGDPWFPNPTTGSGSQAAASISAGRLNNGIDLSGSMLDANNHLIVNAFTNAVPILNGGTYNVQTETLTGGGGLWIQGGGAMKLGAGNSFAGGLTLNGATVELAGAGAAGTGSVAFVDGSVSTLLVDSAAALPSASVNNINVGDQIDLAYLSFGSGGASLTAGTLMVHAGAGTGTFAASKASPVTAFATTRDATGGTLVTAACYAQGTQILTRAGEVSIEDLQVGDLVATRSGFAPVRWLGHRRVDCARHPHPRSVMPVRVRAHAFAANQPTRDLLLSPDHAILADGNLIPIRALINATTIAQVDTGPITYWHIELPAHDVIFADGLPAESYLDTGNRGAFANAGQLVKLQVDFMPDADRAWQTSACAPLVEGGPIVHALRERLAASGPLRMLDIAIHDAGHASATVPAYVDAVRLVSAAGRRGQDRRRLGALLTGLRVDGETIGLDDARLGLGFHAIETHGDRAVRWTDGEAILVVGQATSDRQLDIETAVVTAKAA